MSRSWRRAIRILLLILASLVAAPEAAGAQAEAERAYLRSVAGHFDLPAGEVPFLLDRLQGPAELPVVLFVATRSGVSPEAVLALRRAGWAWQRIVARYGIEPAALYPPLEAPPGEGPLARAYGAYLASSRGGWGGLDLSDGGVVLLVNLVFLTDYLDLPPHRVAAILAEHGDPVAAYRELLRGRLP